MSIGVAVASLVSNDEYAATAEADEQLYVAKHAGRHRVSGTSAESHVSHSA